MPAQSLWRVTLDGQAGQQSVLFDYDPSRSRQVPQRLLDGFKNGYLQTDGYAGYNEVCRRNNLTPVGCMDHARRNFIDAQKAQLKGKKIKASKADVVLSYINKLYSKRYRMPKRWKILKPCCLGIIPFHCLIRGFIGHLHYSTYWF
jgi:hypothetical protein